MFIDDPHEPVDPPDDSPIIIDAKPPPTRLQRVADFLNRMPGTLFAGMMAFVLFTGFVLTVILALPNPNERYAFLADVHYWLSRGGLVVAVVMLAVAVYIGLIRHGDVTRWFRGITYTVVAFMALEGVTGSVLWLMGGRPGEEAHLIYGTGAVLALPFFIFVESTAKKRPAMGSYIWGFTMLAAIIVRTITTGPIG